ncbi:MAG: hypothetical protein AABY13_05110 [Nanoarchaeota archaeon]
MTEVVTQKILDEIKFVRAKVTEIDRELHDLREEFADAHLSEQERKMLLNALEEEREGKTIGLAEMQRRLGL